MATTGYLDFRQFVYNILHMISIQDEKNQILTTNIWLNLVRKHHLVDTEDASDVLHCKEWMAQCLERAATI